jgi:hypothetical protein
LTDGPIAQSSQFGVVGAEEDHERFERINKVLSMIETGQSTLRLVADYEINVRFEAGKGSRFNRQKNEIVIDSTLGHFSAALSLVHEVTHARYFHEGMAADIGSLSRQKYVQMKLDEEISAVVTRNEATMELSEKGVDVSRLRHSIYYPHQQAVRSAIRKARYENPGLNEETLQNIGRAAGREMVREVLVSGQAVRSTNKQSYLEHWQSHWDESRGL